MKILVVEDEEQIASFIQMTLENDGNEVIICRSVEEVLDNDYVPYHDLIILDLMLKGKRSGKDLVNHLRNEKSSIPILVVSALGQIATKIDLINIGADDYMTKPFDAQELVARVNALYRRYMHAEYNEEQRFGDMIFYRKQNKVRRKGTVILLTNKESDVFELLLRNHGKTVKSQDILRQVWKTKVGYHSNVLQSTIRRLRKKVDSPDFGFRLIRNVHGIGYSLILPEDA